MIFQIPEKNFKPSINNFLIHKIKIRDVGQRCTGNGLRHCKSDLGTSIHHGPEASRGPLLKSGIFLTTPGSNSDRSI